MNLGELIEWLSQFNLFGLVFVGSFLWLSMGFFPPLVFDWVEVFTMEKDKRPRAFLGIQQNINRYFIFSIFGMISFSLVIVVVIVKLFMFLAFWSPNEDQ